MSKAVSLGLFFKSILRWQIGSNDGRKEKELAIVPAIIWVDIRIRGTPYTFLTGRREENILGPWAHCEPTWQKGMIEAQEA
jgi:hypothetical protein